MLIKLTTIDNNNILIGTESIIVAKEVYFKK